LGVSWNERPDRGPLEFGREKKRALLRLHSSGGYKGAESNLLIQRNGNVESNGFNGHAGVGSLHCSMFLTFVCVVCECVWPDVGVRLSLPKEHLDIFF
jgi:hypothetical protein